MRATRIGAVLLMPAVAALGAQFQKEAQSAVSSALKISVKAPAQGPREGESATFSLQLQNGKSLPAPMSKDTGVELQLLDSKDQLAKSANCIIPAGRADAKCAVAAPKPGLYKIRAHPDNRELLDGYGYVLIRPSSGAPAKKRPVARMWPGVSFVAVAYSAQQAESEAVPAPAAPAVCGASKSRGSRVILTINEGGETDGGFRAGLESATIQAFFQSDDGGSAPADIFVWLSPNHGDVDHQPLVIPKCSISGEAHLSSKYPVLTTVSYKVLPATYGVDAPVTLQANFVRPIVGIGIVPTGLQTLSLIDRVPIVAQFFDADGNAIPTDAARTVTFVSGNSVIGLQQETISLKPGDLSADTEILPFWLGTAAIFVSADHLKTAQHQVQVVGVIVLIVCLIGGLIGGLVSFFSSGGQLYNRLVVSVAAGIVLSWGYVFGILSKVDSSVAHNYISVFVVSLLGGYLGIKVFDLVLKRLGWST